MLHLGDKLQHEQILTLPIPDLQKHRQQLHTSIIGHTGLHPKHPLSESLLFGILNQNWLLLPHCKMVYPFQAYQYQYIGPCKYFHPLNEHLSCHHLRYDLQFPLGGLYCLVYSLPNLMVKSGAKEWE